MATPDLLNLTSGAPGILTAGAALLATGEVTVYTVPANRAAKLLKAVLANTSAASVTVAVSVVPSGGTAGVANRVVASYALAAGDSTLLTELEGIELGAGDFVSVNSSAGTAIAAMISGRVYS